MIVLLLRFLIYDQSVVSVLYIRLFWPGISSGFWLRNLYNNIMQEEFGEWVEAGDKEWRREGGKVGGMEI